MNREQLERLGEAGLRRMARQVGLRGARHHDRSLLITGLAAYFARRPAGDEGDDEAYGEAHGEARGEPNLAAAEIPPALTTETMARLLESQGEAAHASALRARLDGGPDRATAAPGVRVERGARDRIELVWEGAAGAQPGLMVRLWTPDDQTQWELPVTAPQGRMQIAPPPNVTRLCAALGRLSPDGFVPAARSAVIVLGAPKKTTRTP